MKFKKLFLFIAFFTSAVTFAQIDLNYQTPHQNILSLADPLDKIKAYNLLSEIDPANISKYEGLKRNKY